MGMTYAELTVFGKLRKEHGCGPFAMFCKLIHMWGDKMSPEEVCADIKICNGEILHICLCHNVNISSTVSFEIQ